MVLRQIRIAIAIGALGLSASQISLAQYGGGMGGAGSGTGTPNSPSYTTPSGGYKANRALIGGLAAGGAAAFGGIYYATRHNLYKGCVGTDGKTLSAKGKLFRLEGSGLTPGEKVALKARKSDSDSTGNTLAVQDIKKDYGACEQVAKK